MRLLSSLTAALALVVDWSLASQTAFAISSSSPTPSTQADSLVSALSASDQHTIFLRLLQRSKSIPLLAHIGNATLYAPTDDAWKEWFRQHTPSAAEHEPYLGWLTTAGYEEWLLEEADLLQERIRAGIAVEDCRHQFDNQNWALRQHLLYHMLNYTLAPSDMVANAVSNVSIETTLLFPLSEPPDLPPTPPPGPPWLPRGGEGLLGGHGQRIRLARAGSREGGERGKIGVDHNGEGGIDVWDGSGWKARGNQSNWMDINNKIRLPGARWTRNGVVVGVNGVLEPPPSLDVVIRSHPDLSYLSKLLAASTPLPLPLPENLATAQHLTVFAPTNEAFHRVFDDVEKRYLEGGYGAEGVARVFAGSVVLGVKSDGVGWSDVWGSKPREVETASGLDLAVETLPTRDMVVNGTEVCTVDVFASNGVLHIIPSLLLPENFTLLNSAEKVLLSINATRFVSLLRSANLSSTYIGEPGRNQTNEAAWTILAPTDDTLDVVDKWSGSDALSSNLGRIPSENDTPAFRQSHDFEDASPIAALLQYHLLPGRLLPSDIRDGMLVETELRTSNLNGGRQRLRVSVADNLGQRDWESIGHGEIEFGASTVLGKPVKVGKSIIYLISSLLAPPDDVLQTAVSDLQLSTFVAAVYAADLDRAIKKAPAISYFVPRNRAFGYLGLGMKYLLLPEGKDELRKVIRYHAITRVVYTSDIEPGRTTLNTLEGGEIVLRRSKSKNGTLTLSSPTKWDGHDSGENYPANGELRPAQVGESDALTSSGVIHTIDSVIMPADIALTIRKLIRGSRQATMVDLMVRAGLGWILEGREPTSDELAYAILQGIVKGTDDEIGDGLEPDAESLAMPSYAVLVPTDKAFSRLNLTQYLHDREALLDLLKLHIIPTQPSTPRTGTTRLPAEPPKDGQPLSMADDLIYSTLLSSKSKYGDIAFRATGDNSFIVGIRGSRNNAGMDFARVGQSGRASVRWRKTLRAGGHHPDNDKQPHNHVNLELWSGGMALGGGVLVIDSVLVPYEPSWFSRWGWLVITLVGVGIVLLIAAASIGWWWMTKGKHEQYEPLEGEEEE